MNKLELLHQKYGKKIWLTEFAKCCTRDENEVINFMKVGFTIFKSMLIDQFQEIIPRLEAADYVHRYSWFITRYNDKIVTRMDGNNTDWYLDKVNALFIEGSTELSQLGKLYNTL